MLPEGNMVPKKVMLWFEEPAVCYIQMLDCYSKSHLNFS